MSDSPLQDMSREEILFCLLKKEQGYYESILHHIEAEKHVLNQKQNIHLLKKLNNKKQLLFTCIEEIESAIQPLKRLWQQSPSVDDPFHPKVKDEFIKLDNLLQKILKLDEPALS